MKKVEISFKHSDGTVDVLGYCGEFEEKKSDMNYPLFTFKNSFLMINRFLTNFPNFKHYYTRINYPRNDDYPFTWTFDVGSWSEFFYVTYNGEEWENSEDNYINCSKELFTLKNPLEANKLLEECNNE